MTKKTNYILFVSTLFFAFLHGNSTTVKCKEDAVIQICYNKITNRDTIGNTFYSESPMILRAGKTSAMFYPEKIMYLDSLNYFCGNLGDEMIFETMLKGLPVTSVGGWDKQYLFRNITDGQTEIYEKISTYYLSYSEPTEIPNWNIIGDTKELLGYTCTLAKCYYRGREWNAWFAPEIPIQEGPWKLCGLPGLILEAYDSKRQYEFKAIELKTNSLPSVGIYLYDKTQHDKLKNRYEFLKTMNHLQLKAKYMDEVIQITNLKPSKSDNVPLYDYEETDYPHK